jgi:hypothetical protein
MLINIGEELFRIIVVINSTVMLILALDTYRRLVGWDIKDLVTIMWLHSPRLTRKQWFDRAVSRSVPLLSELSKRAMDEHFEKGSIWVPETVDPRFPSGHWIPASKPGPGHGIHMFIYALEHHDFDSSVSAWEQLEKIGSKEIDGIWESLESREGLKYPLADFKLL